MQRRRTAEDELNMRAVYEEGDLVGVNLPLPSGSTSAWCCCVCILSAQHQVSPLALVTTVMPGRQRCSPCTLMAPSSSTLAAPSMARYLVDCLCNPEEQTCIIHCFNPPLFSWLTCCRMQLQGGQLLTVPSNIIKRQKQHFHSMKDLGVPCLSSCRNVCLDSS